MKMGKSKAKAEEIITSVRNGESIDSIRDRIASTQDEWYSYSGKAYSIGLENAKKARKKRQNEPHVLSTSNEEILEIIDLNDKLISYALVLPVFTTTGGLKRVKSLAERLPETESEILSEVGLMTISPNLRALQKRGRIEVLEPFKPFSKLVDAAVLSYYRGNYISCYLTLLPVVEGVILRWMGYTESDEKPDFEKIRKFFKSPALRQPCPTNIMFHEVYVKACDKILNYHFFRNTKASGNAYANFNRHVASHLLNDSQFATKSNCIRLLALLDIMTEVYVYESRNSDPRFDIRNEQIELEVNMFSQLIAASNSNTPESRLLGDLE